jgi:hypothetical protein
MQQAANKGDQIGRNFAFWAIFRLLGDIFGAFLP